MRRTTPDGVVLHVESADGNRMVLGRMSIAAAEHALYAIRDFGPPLLCLCRLYLTPYTVNPAALVEC